MTLPARKCTAFLLVYLTLGPAAVPAQVQQSPAGPEIATTGTATITLPPDRALVRIGIATRAATASAASAPNGPLVQRVQDTLRALNLSGPPVRAISFGVTPNYDYQRGRQLIDYEARTTLEVVLNDVPALGRLLDAALGAGATDISSIIFQSDSTPVARRRALATALANAREDAEALARAAGGRLGPIRHATTTPEANEWAGYARALSAPAMMGPMGVPAVQRDVIIGVMVQVRWAFLPR